MLSIFAHGLAIVLDLFIIFIGARFLLAPSIAATGYGVPAKADGDSAYLAVKGVRDFSLGLIGLALLAFVDARAAAWFMLGAEPTASSHSRRWSTTSSRPRRTLSR